MSVVVSNIRAWSYAGPLRRPFVTSRRRVDTVTGVIAELTLPDGTVGYGSAAQTLAVTGESVESILAALNGPIRQALTGDGERRGLRAAADAIASSCVGNFSAKAAADVALHDAWARSLDLPLVTALGGDTETVLRTDMTVSLGPPETMARSARHAAQQGFDVLKVKLGSDWRADLERLERVRSEVPSARFRLDANQAWDTKSAVRIIREIEDAGIPLELVEQPVPKHDLDGLATVTAAVHTPIMADESIGSPRDAFEIATRNAADLVNIKLAKCGGIGQALAIAEITRTAGLECMIGAMMEPRISITAAAHVAAAHPNITLVDLDSAEWIDDPELTGGYTLSGDRIQLCRTAGLGFGTDVPDHITRAQQ